MVEPMMTLLSRFAFRPGIGATLPAFLLIGGGGTWLSAAEPAGQAGAPTTVVWTFNNLQSVGGQAPKVLGAPRIKAEERAAYFNGVGDGLILPVNPLAGLAQFTIEVLFRPETGGAGEQRFFHVQDEAGSRGLLEIRLTPEGQWALDTFLLSGESSLPLLDRTKLHPADRWHWVALEYENHRMTSFVNGQKELEGTVDFAPMKSGQTSLGVRLNHVFWFKGSIREVRIHSTALAGDQLQHRL